MEGKQETFLQKGAILSSRATPNSAQQQGNIQSWSKMGVTVVVVAEKEETGHQET